MKGVRWHYCTNKGPGTPEESKCPEEDLYIQVVESTIWTVIRPPATFWNMIIVMDKSWLNWYDNQEKTEMWYPNSWLKNGTQNDSSEIKYETTVFEPKK